MFDDTQQYVANVQALRSRFGGWRAAASRGPGHGVRTPRPAVQARSTGATKFARGPRAVPTLARMTRPRQIVAFGGGGFSMEAGNPLLDDYVLGLAAAAGRDRPKVCFLPTASGDADHYIVRFYRHFPASRCEPSHVSLFRRDCGTDDVRAHLLEQDLVYVGGGSVICLMGVLRAHGLDVALREAWEAGVVLCGLSAGSLCWFAEAMTGYHGNSRPVEGIGLLQSSNAVHYDKEAHRRPAYHAAIGGGMPGGYAAEDGAALHFVGDELARVVSSRPASRAFSVDAVARRGRRDAAQRRTTWEPPPRNPRLRPEPGSGSAPRRAGRPPTIFAMGGGGFTMEPENPALDDYVRTLSPAREPRICLLPTAGGDSEDQIRRFHMAFVGQALRADAHLAVPARAASRAAARPPAGAGHHLRRRRLDDQPARALACARARRDPARGLAGGDRAGRPQRRLDVLVRVGRDQVGRDARCPPAGSGSFRARTPCTTTASRSAGPCS